MEGALGPGWCPFCSVSVAVGACSTWLRTWNMNPWGSWCLVFGRLEEGEVKKGGQGHLPSERDVIEM